MANTVAVDTTSTGGGSSNPVTVAHTCSSSTKMLAVMVYSSGGFRTDSVPSYNSVNMSDSGQGEVPCYPGGSKLNVELFLLENPSTGSSYNVSVPNTNGVYLWIDVISLEATGALSLHLSNSAISDTGNPSVSITTTVDDCCLLGACAHDKNNLGGYSPGSGFTTIYAVDVGSDTYFDEYMTDCGTAGSKTIDFVQALDDWAEIAVAIEEASGPATVNETISLANYKGVYPSDNVNVLNGVTFSIFKGHSASEGLDIQESISQAIFKGISSSLIAEFDETTTLSIFKGIIPSSQVNAYESTNLVIFKGIVHSSQVNVYDSVTLNRINYIPTSELGTIFDLIALNRIDGLTVLEEVQGGIDETIILNRVMGLSANSQVNVYDSVTLNRINYIPTTSLGNLQNLVTLNRIDGLTVIEEIQGAIYETIVLNKILGLTPSSQVNVYDSVAINVIRGLNSSSQMSYDESVIMNIVRGLTTSELLKVSEIVSINAFYGLTTPELLEISEFIQLSREEGLILSNNVVIFDSISLPIWRILTIKPTGKFVITNVKADNAFFIIFRDKRYPIIFRDKRFGAIFRDKSTKGGS